MRGFLTIIIRLLHASEPILVFVRTMKWKTTAIYGFLNGPFSQKSIDSFTVCMMVVSPLVTDDFKLSKSCTVTLLPKDWDPVTHQAVTKFEVLAERDFKKDGDKNLVLKFTPIYSVDAPPVFYSYHIPYMQVQGNT